MSMVQLADACRGIIVAPPGSSLVIADLSAIEGRVLAWLAGEQWVLNAYVAGRDMYKVDYSTAFGVPYEDVTKAQRQLGKVLNLFGGYGGGVGAFVTFAATYAVDLAAMAANVKAVMPPAEFDEHLHTYWEWAKPKGFTYDLPAETWAACNLLKARWRAAHPATVELWKAAQSAVLAGSSAVGPHMHVTREGRWTHAHLPSGRSIVYADVLSSGRGLSFNGVNSLTTRWERIASYGGMLVENATQAVARDVMAHGLLRAAELPGHAPVLTVHDEIVCETPHGTTHEPLVAAMCVVPQWALGLPLAAAGETLQRYQK